MANVEYRVIIENATDGGEGDAPVSFPGGERPDNTPTPEKAKKKQDKGALALGLVAVNQITPYITQAVNFGISQISMTTGSDELQRKAQAVSGVVGGLSGIGMAAITGGLPAAAIAAGMTALQSIISVQQNLATIANQRRIEDENIALKRSRAGLSVNRSRTGGIA
ncbi:MAG: hypothetical protein IKC26_02050 [Clostridia bacterium]|nr:hypothetical protein [Clostridia bacterium]